MRGLMQVPSLLLLAGLAACAASDARRAATERTDSAGVEIVRVTGGDVALGWTLEPVASIDPENSGAEVINPTRTGVLSDAAGRIYVLDRQGARVAIFDAGGRYLRSQGGRGGGPGELQSPLGLAVSQDGTVAVFDMGKGRLVRFGPDGAVLEEWPLQGFFGGTVRLAGDAVLHDHHRFARTDQAGTRGIRRIRPAAPADSAMLVERPNAPTRPIRLESCGMGFSGMGPVFEPYVRWDAQTDRVVLAGGAEYDVRVLEGEREVRRLRRDIAPQLATAELAMQELGEGMKVGVEGETRVCRADEVVEKRGFAPVIPALGALVLSPAGELWVQRGGITDQPRPIDVWSAGGDYLGTLPAGTPLPSAFLPDDRIAVVETDELDVARVVIYRVRR